MGVMIIMTPIDRIGAHLGMYLPALDNKPTDNLRLWR